MRSRPGAARTILLFHTISVRPSKQPQIMEYVPSPKVFDGLILKKNNKQHDHHRAIYCSFSETNFVYLWRVRTHWARDVTKFQGDALLAV